MATINPYLNFKGNTEEAFNFYKTVFGGEFTALMRFRDIPAQEGCDGATVAEHELDKIMHIALPIGNGNILMATDGLESMGQYFTVGNNISFRSAPKAARKSINFFGALSESGSYSMPPADAFWGDYFGMCVDKFGIRWMFSYSENQK